MGATPIIIKTESGTTQTTEMALGGICQGSDTRAKSGTGTGMAGNIVSGDTARITTDGDKPMRESYLKLLGSRGRINLTERTPTTSESLS